jgi:antitoxin MazE
MTTTVKTHIIKIGNSQGIRIPRLVLQQAGIERDVELEVQPGQLVVRGLRHPREGWEEQFREMAKAGDDLLLDEELNLTDWETNEWQW